MPFNGSIRMAADADEFLRLVPDALADNAPARRVERTSMARHHTWEQRVAVVQQALERHLVKREAFRAAHGAGQPAVPPRMGS
jgi:hypothetical protein